MSKLLPPNSTRFDRNVTDVCANSLELPVQIKSLASIDQAPDHFLSFLAWQYSVDSWDTDWQPSLQRQLIKKSFRQHQIKGTRTAVREVLAQFGYTCEFQEWFETVPNGVPGTFSLTLDLNGLELTDATYAEVNRLVKDAKPASRHLTNLVTNVQPLCIPRVAIGCHGAETVTIFVE
ncbi:phage tail protein I [Acinetobacter baumannii]|uniref:phage tail protein I n=1 Tax=Acinetobacter baumannii TaxID=470 RepID=UPI000DE76B13|nr:phage tail protein I [Acinetobacter baumannii]SSI45130.1 putative prophage tail protein [Acinetobacter baumannii]SSP01285.1 phage-related tail protein I (GPI-like) [Acinetobacter baumannii]